MPKKLNSRRRPVTQADIDKAKREATDAGVTYAWAIFFSVLRDKEGADVETLRRIWAEVEDLSDSVVRGYVSIRDLQRTLEEEIGAVLR